MRASSTESHTRLVFRILAGIMAAFILLVGVPAGLFEARNDTWEGLFMAFCSLYAGIGLALGARTGRWFGS